MHIFFIFPIFSLKYTLNSLILQEYRHQDSNLLLKTHHVRRWNCLSQVEMATQKSKLILFFRGLRKLFVFWISSWTCGLVCYYQILCFESSKGIHTHHLTRMSSSYQVENSFTQNQNQKRFHHENFPYMSFSLQIMLISLMKLMDLMLQLLVDKHFV